MGIMKANDWISIKDRLPKIGERVIVCQSFNDERRIIKKFVEYV